MKVADRDYLTDMLRYAETAVEFLGPANAMALTEDKKTFFAVCYAMQTVGEAANQVSVAGRAQLAEIPWADVIGMRQHIVHGYRTILPEVIARTINHDLPTLIASLRRNLEGDCP